MSEPSTPVISLQKLHKRFPIGNRLETIIRGVDLDVFPEDFLILFGPSGSGKTTLLNLMTGLEAASSGEVVVAGHSFHGLSEDQRAKIRARTFGVVHQQPIWLKSLSVLENVALPLLLRGESERVAFRQAKTKLRETGMNHYLKQKPTELSGGQQQRVSLARALVSHPRVLVLDEPTGSLDTTAADQMFSLVQAIHRDQGCAVVMVTHNPVYLPFANRVVVVEDGKTRNGDSLKRLSS